MSGTSFVLNHVRAHDALLEALTAQAAEIESLGADLIVVLQAGGKILTCGNGGSATQSQHLASELVGRFQINRAPLPAISLAADISILTCVGNDFGYADVFARQVTALGQPRDVLVAFSTSGRSPNILAAIESAQQIGMKVIGLSGYDGGNMREACSGCLVLPLHNTALIQEAHLAILHIWCQMIEAALWPELQK